MLSSPPTMNTSKIHPRVRQLALTHPGGRQRGSSGTSGVKKDSGFPSASAVENPPAMQEMGFLSLGWDDSLEEGLTTHSSILASTGEPGGLQSIGLHRVRHD